MFLFFKRMSLNRRCRKLRREIIAFVKAQELSGFDDFRGYQKLQLDLSIAEGELRELNAPARRLA